MKSVIKVGDEEAGHKIMRLAGEAVFNPKGETCISHYLDGKLAGGIVYSNYSRRAVEMHVAGFRPGWVSRDLLWVAFDYPFSQLGCDKVFGRVQASNADAMKFNLNLGFKVEAVLKDVFEDGDLNILSMYRSDCRHLKIVPRGIKLNGVASNG